jgi:hypothetical protein
MYNFNIPFFHLLLQAGIITYSMLSKRLYLYYKDEEEKEVLDQMKIKKRIEMEKNDQVRFNLFKSKGLGRERKFSSAEPLKRQSMSSIAAKRTTWEIIANFIVSNWDIVLVIALYFAGSYQIDIYHITLMIFFVMFLLYPAR